MMRRRDLLAAGAGACGLGVGAWYLRGSGRGNRVSPVEIRTIDARGSTAGTMRVPVHDSATLLDVFSITCAPCETETRRLNGLREELGSGVRLVSVTNDAVGGTLTREDVRRWWRDADGHWPVGFDDEGQLMAELGVTGLPTLALVGPDGKLAWKHAGLVSKRDLLDAVRGLEGR